MNEADIFLKPFYEADEQAKYARKVLGVPENSSPARIRSAFRKLAKQYHPDTNPDNAAASEQFRIVLCAYRFLTGKADSMDMPARPGKILEKNPDRYTDNAWGKYCWYVDNFMMDFLGFRSGKP